MHIGEMLGGGVALATEKPPESTAIDRLGQEAENLARRCRAMATRAKALADKLEGSHLEEAEAPAEQATPNGAIDAIGRDLERQIAGLDDLDTAISRLERLI